MTMPRTMLLALLPETAALAEARRCLRVLATTLPVAAVVVPAETTAFQEELIHLRAEAHDLAIACLVTNDVEACTALQADGVLLHAATPKQVRQTRMRLGQEAIIGACCPSRRHALMELGEAGADWLGVDQRVEAGGENLLAWAAQMITLPLAAMQPAPPEDVARLRTKGADFIVPVPDVWESERRASALAAAYAAALDA